MTAQCALIWVPWKFSGLPDYAHGYTFPKIVWAFVPISSDRALVRALPVGLHIRLFVYQHSAAQNFKFQF